MNMGKVINFSKSLKIQQSKHQAQEATQQTKSQTNLWTLFEEEKFFTENIKSWPCFSNIKKNLSPSDLLTQYCDNLLSESQECVIDFMLHIHDPSFVFDLHFSLQKWNRKNRDFFLCILKKHASNLP